MIEFIEVGIVYLLFGLSFIGFMYLVEWLYRKLP